MFRPDVAAPTDDPTPAARLPRLLAATLLLVLALAGTAAAETRVTLGFDDATRGQLGAATILDELGLQATFYVNSGALGRDDRMTWEQIRGLAARGHEIGGHGVDHFDSTLLQSEDLRRNICDDRAALVDEGLIVSSFAYPNGRTNPEAEQVVRDCGYTNGRALGGIFPSQICPAPLPCLLAEGIPAGNPWATRAAPPINNRTTLRRLQEHVLRAELTGGWLQLVFHHVDADHESSIRSSTIQAFASWLAAREVLGTRVMTAGEAAGTPPEPGPHVVPNARSTTRTATLAPGRARPRVRCATACIVEVTVTPTSASAPVLGLRAGMPAASGTTTLDQAGIAAVPLVPLPSAAGAWGRSAAPLPFRVTGTVTSSP